MARSFYRWTFDLPCSRSRLGSEEDKGSFLLDIGCRCSPLLLDIFVYISMRGSVRGGRAIMALQRTKVGLPAVFLCCGLFFLAGFFASMIPPVVRTSPLLASSFQIFPDSASLLYAWPATSYFYVTVVLFFPGTSRRKPWSSEAV